MVPNRYGLISITFFTVWEAANDTRRLTKVLYVPCLDLSRYNTGPITEAVGAVFWAGGRSYKYKTPCWLVSRRR